MKKMDPDLMVLNLEQICDPHCATNSVYFLLPVPFCFSIYTRQFHWKGSVMGGPPLFDTGCQGYMPSTVDVCNIRIWSYIQKKKTKDFYIVLVYPIFCLVQSK